MSEPFPKSVSDTKVSVILPCLNGGRFLGTALSSVYSQSTKAFQVIVVDDGSTDDSVSIAESFGCEVLRTSGREGPANARNLGATRAAGAWLAFLDVDDWWESDHLEKALAWSARLNASVLSTRSRNEGIAAESNFAPMTVDWIDLIASNPIIQSCVMVTSDAFRAIGGYRDGVRFSEDYDLWLRLGSVGHTIGVAPNVTCVRRVHSDQLSRRTGEMIVGAWSARRRVLSSSDWSDDATEGRVPAALQQAFAVDLGFTWHSGDSNAYDFLRKLSIEIACLSAPWNDFTARASSWRVAQARSWMRKIVGRH